MRNILFWSSLGWASSGLAHMGHHEVGFGAALLHAFSALAPAAPAAAVILAAWWYSRRYR